MNNKLFLDILKAYENLNEIRFKVSGNEYLYYYKHMTILEHARINMRCQKQTVTIKNDGTKEIKEEKQEHLFPVYTILEKALDENGKKLYSMTDKEAFDNLIKMDIKLISMIAAEMALDITGNLGEING